MKLSQIKQILDASIHIGEENLDTEVFSGCGSDLMSDVLAFSKEKVVLLTGLVNPQVIRTAEMLDIKAIVFVRGKEPSEDMIKLAAIKELVIMSTANTLYKACGLLYSNGLVQEEQ